VSILKKGIVTLASRIAHLVNRSLASGIAPDEFKTALVHPVYKGGGKSRSSPSSYRPVAILPALSKILEVAVKESLEEYLKNIDAIPTTQYGFRRGRSCTTALAAAHASWRMAVSKSKVVGVMAFDLSCAFDTVAKDRLLPKLQTMGMYGTELAWFDSYMTGGLQAVVWDGVRSTFVGLRFGVCQGSILGPLLYLCHVADLPDCLGLGEEGNSGYADDTGVWVVHDDPPVVEMELQVLADKFSAFTKGNGLLLNGAKTQLLLSLNVKKQVADSFEILVDGNIVKPADNLDRLGVKFDQQFTVRPHKE
jgi:hypothetical protein